MRCAMLRKTRVGGRPDGRNWRWYGMGNVHFQLSAGHGWSRLRVGKPPRRRTALQQAGIPDVMTPSEAPVLAVSEEDVIAAIQARIRKHGRSDSHTGSAGMR